MNVAVIGGGVMGLTVAYRLVGAGHRVTVFESAPQLGGLATWYDYGAFTWDKYYHVITPTDTALIGLLDELGLGGRLEWIETKTGFLWRGRLISMSNYWEFLTFPALNLFQKFQLGFGLIRCRLIRTPDGIQDLTASVWLTRMFGRGVYEAVWEPLLECKFGVLKDRVPATLMWATIVRYQNTRSDSSGKERMGYVSGGGARVLIEALRDAVVSAGGTVECGIEVKNVERADDAGVRVITSSGEHCFDRVISTLPTHISNRILANALELHGSASAPSEPLGVICATLILRQAKTPFYLTNPIDRGLPFTGIIELSNLIGSEERAGKTVLMLPRYDVPNSPWFDKSDDVVVKEFVSALRGIWPEIESEIEATHVNRERVVQQVWVNGAPSHDRPRMSSDGRIAVINNELAGEDTLNNNAVIRVANESVEYVLATEHWTGAEASQAAPLNRAG